MSVGQISDEVVVVPEGKSAGTGQWEMSELVSGCVSGSGTVWKE